MFRSWLLSVLAAVPLLAVAVAQDPYTNKTDGNGHTLPLYSPARPPALPLAVRSPYTHTWSSVGEDGTSTLNSADTIFWTGNTTTWEGIVTVDGVSYEYMGAGSQRLPKTSKLQTAVPLTVNYDSQYSNFTFQAGPVQILASFFSPVTPKDICRTSIPLSYMTASVQSTDGRNHDVQFYQDIGADWVSNESDEPVTWTMRKGSRPINGTRLAGSGTSLYSWLLERQNPYVFGELADLNLWGNVSYSSAAQGARNFTFGSGYAVDLRWNYTTDNYLSDYVDPDYRGAGDNEPVFAYSHDFGMVYRASVMYTIGSIQTPMMRYLYSGGLAELEPWWAKCYGDMYSMIDYHWNDVASVKQLGADFEASLKYDVDAYYQDEGAQVYSNQTGSPGAPPDFPAPGNFSYSHGITETGEQYIFNSDNGYGWLDPTNFTGIGVPDVSEAETYYSIVAITARQVMGAYVYCIPPSGDDSEPLMFQKEISSDGNVNTVDVLYPATPYFLWANPEMLRYTLAPLYANQEGGFYPNGYSMHDLGSSFPNATGHVEGDDEYMPVEECGNMILMSYAYYKYSGNADWLTSHYGQLQQWAQYLIDFSLIPGAQLSTDDFAGTLENQTNLAMKGIVGIQAMSGVARVAGELADAANYSATATEYYAQWEYYGLSPDGAHSLLAYEWRSSAGLLYNTYYDKALDLGLVSSSLYEALSSWYPTVSQVYGVPLDNRHTYTKSDWMMMTAATCSPETRRYFVTALGYWLNETTVGAPFPDLFETISDGYFPTVPNAVTFKARPVVGGHFALLALYRSGQTDTSGADESTWGSDFPANSTAALSLVQLPSQASLDLGPPGSGSATQVPYTVTTVTRYNASTTYRSTLTSYTQSATVSPVSVVGNSTTALRG
ncbi:hypothetical protein GGR56DRAFT_647998 [Xylariaceae sp. FL0804]|nr:hypothetical protein GGR56DRAFT_647998 [Xylariaceae sp. FL0804]